MFWDGFNETFYDCTKDTTNARKIRRSVERSSVHFDMSDWTAIATSHPCTSHEVSVATGRACTSHEVSAEVGRSAHRTKVAPLVLAHRTKGSLRPAILAHRTNVPDLKPT